MILIYLVLSLSFKSALAYVDMVSSGYVSCLACHHSPSGGGILTDYGRSLSKEHMSTWGWKNSELPLFGMVKNSEKVNIGGHIRAIQTRVQNDDVKQGKLFLMQNNLELSLRAGDIKFIGTIGTQEGPDETPRKGRILSERHFALIQASPSSYLKVGKARTQFGLSDPNHTRPTKALLGFGSNSESYQMEYSHFTTFGEAYLATFLGRIDLPRDERSEKGQALTLAKYVGSKSKIGASVLLGENPSKRRRLYAIHGVMTLAESLYTKFEVDLESYNLTSNPNKTESTSTSFASLNYKFTKGLNGYVFHEHAQTDTTKNETLQTSPGIGLQWLPIPHVEVSAEVKRTTRRLEVGNPTDVAWVICHLYL